MSRGSGSRRRPRHLEDLFRAGAVGDLGDAELIDQFIRGRDGSGESAFAALVERHGPMVLRVCMQALDDPHAAEDAAQATFLVLARQAGSIRDRDSVASWLFGVARRASARLRMKEARRRRHESRAAERVSAAPLDPPAPDDPYPELHAEIDRLPEKYRLPIVLCYLEGLTHDQAARRLRWPVGTVKTRLSRGRDRLRARLERPGSSSPLWPAAVATRAGIPAELPGRLLESIVQAGCPTSTKGIACAAIPSTIIELSQEVMKAMLWNRLKAAVLIPGLFLLGLGALVAASQVAEKDRGRVPDAPAPRPDAAPTTLNLLATTDYDPAMVAVVRVPFACRVDRVLVDLGASVKAGDPLLEVFSADLAAAKGEYELALSQWQHDRKVLDYKAPLAKADTLPRKELIDVENAEAQSRLKMKLARDRLLIYGLTDREIDASRDQDGQEKARMIVRARMDGVVVKRNVAPGSFCNPKDELLTTAALDHLRVHGDISENDADRVQVGQPVKVILSFGRSVQAIAGKIDVIERVIHPVTRQAKFWTTIPNPPGSRYGAGGSVRVEIPTIPRPGEPHPPAGPEATTPAPSAPAPASADRLDAIERKLDRLLGEADERSSRSRILERLDALERKVDRLLDRR